MPVAAADPGHGAREALYKALQISPAQWLTQSAVPVRPLPAAGQMVVRKEDMDFIQPDRADLFRGPPSTHPQERMFAQADKVGDGFYLNLQSVYQKNGFHSSHVFTSLHSAAQWFPAVRSAQSAGRPLLAWELVRKGRPCKGYLDVEVDPRSLWAGELSDLVPLVIEAWSTVVSQVGLPPTTLHHVPITDATSAAKLSAHFVFIDCWFANNEDLGVFVKHVRRAMLDMAADRGASFVGKDGKPTTALDMTVFSSNSAMRLVYSHKLSEHKYAERPLLPWAGNARVFDDLDYVITYVPEEWRATRPCVDVSRLPALPGTRRARTYAPYEPPEGMLNPITPKELCELVEEFQVADGDREKRGLGFELVDGRADSTGKFETSRSPDGRVCFNNDDNGRPIEHGGSNNVKVYQSRRGISAGCHSAQCDNLPKLWLYEFKWAPEQLAQFASLEGQGREDGDSSDDDDSDDDSDSDEDQGASKEEAPPARKPGAVSGAPAPKPKKKLKLPVVPARVPELDFEMYVFPDVGKVVKDLNRRAGTALVDAFVMRVKDSVKYDPGYKRYFVWSDTLLLWQERTKNEVAFMIEGAMGWARKYTEAGRGNLLDHTYLRGLEGFACDKLAAPLEWLEGINGSVNALAVAGGLHLDFLTLTTRPRTREDRWSIELSSSFLGNKWECCAQAVHYIQTLCKSAEGMYVDIKFARLKTVLGRIFSGDPTLWKHIIVMVGKLDSGKSKLVNLLCKMGASLTATLKTAIFTGVANENANQHDAGWVPLMGKRFGWMSETETSNTSLQYQPVAMIAGDRRLPIRRPGVVAADAGSLNTCQPALLCNDMPDLGDANNRRKISKKLFIVTFDHEFESTAANRAYAQSLDEPAFLSQLLTMVALCSHEELHRTDAEQLRNSASTREADAYSSNTVVKFTAVCLHQQDGAWLGGQEVVEVYRWWCEKHGHAVEKQPDRKFAAAMGQTKIRDKKRGREGWALAPAWLATLGLEEQDAVREKLDGVQVRFASQEHEPAGADKPGQTG